jgi:hypothetical protein
MCTIANASGACIGGRKNSVTPPAESVHCSPARRVSLVPAHLKHRIGTELIENSPVRLCLKLNSSQGTAMHCTFNKSPNRAAAAITDGFREHHSSSIEWCRRFGPDTAELGCSRFCPAIETGRDSAFCRTVNIERRSSFQWTFPFSRCRHGSCLATASPPQLVSVILFCVLTLTSATGCLN